mgnify:CR=1 FL=1
MRPSSAKAKGRKLQKWFTETLIQQLGLDEDDQRKTVRVMNPC